MKVLLLNTSERTGGAAVAANRLFFALLKRKVDVSFLVKDKSTDNPGVDSVNRSWFSRKINQFRFLWERLFIFICNKGNRKNLFQVSIANTGNDILSHPLVREADIIHIHWINQGFLSINTIGQLIRTGKPIVWTLHDLWPATGICHYPGTCERYKIGCYNCPKLIDRSLWDLADTTFRRKKSMGLDKVYFVGCSQWITARTQQSKLLQGAIFHSIPNPIDTNLFSRRDQKRCRQELGLEVPKKYLLFAAAKLSDERKGANYLIEACRLLKDQLPDLEILLMGNGSQDLIGAIPFPVNGMGYVTEEKKMAMIYAAADLFVIPSLEDNLPNTIMEAMAAGTPCVGFDTGGIPEMIDHKQNGYVARYKDAGDLAMGIRWVLAQKEKADLSAECIRKVNEHYREEVVSTRYIELYNHLLEQKND